MNTISNAMMTLWGKSKAHLSEDELQAMSDLKEAAQYTAGNLRHIVEGIGCMVLADDSAIHQAGNFRTADSVSTLLFSIAGQIDLIDGLIQVSSEAQNRLTEIEPKAIAKGSKA